MQGIRAVSSDVYLRSKFVKSINNQEIQDVIISLCKYMLKTKHSDIQREKKANT